MTNLRKSSNTADMEAIHAPMAMKKSISSLAR